MADTKISKGAPELEVRNLGEAAILKYKNVIIGLIVAVIVCVGVGFFVKNCTTEQFNAANTDMSKAFEYFNRALMSDDSVMYAKALNGDSIDAGFLTVAEQYSSSKAGNVAKLCAGLCYAHLGKMEEAAEYLEQFDAADDAMVSPAAVGALADVKASMGQLDEAVKLYKKAADKADNNALSPQYLIKAGEILESQDKMDDALKLYEEIKSKYVNSVQSRNIDAYIERVK